MLVMLGLYLGIQIHQVEELLKPNNKKTSNPIKKWGKDLNTYITRENIYMADKQMKRCSVSNIIRELQAKTKLRSLHTY